MMTDDIFTSIVMCLSSPHAQINLRHGMGYPNSEKTTCTACAGSMLLEFAALSRLTGAQSIPQL